MVNAAETSAPAGKFVGCPRKGPPGLTSFAGPGATLDLDGVRVVVPERGRERPVGEVVDALDEVPERILRWRLGGVRDRAHGHVRLRSGDDDLRAPGVGRREPVDGLLGDGVRAGRDGALVDPVCLELDRPSSDHEAEVARRPRRADDDLAHLEAELGGATSAVFVIVQTGTPCCCGARTSPCTRRTSS